MLRMDHGEGFLAVALVHALVVSYCRPFTQRRDREGQPEQEEYLAPFRESYTEAEQAMHDRLIELRHQVIGHSDATRSETTIRSDHPARYIVHQWAGRRPLGTDDLSVVEGMVHKLREPLRRRMDQVKEQLLA